MYNDSKDKVTETDRGRHDAASFINTSSLSLGETNMRRGRQSTDTAVKAVKGGVEVEARSQAVHL